MLTVSDDKAADWVQCLYSSASVPTLSSDATPEDRQSAPLPRRKSDRNNQARAAKPLEASKKLTVEQNRELEKRKIELVNRFFADKVLKGKARAHLHEAELLTTSDFKALLHGIKLARFKKGRISDLLKFSVLQPENADQASFTNEESEFSCPNHQIRKTENG